MNQFLTEARDAELTRLYPDTSNKDLAKHFGTTVKAVQSRAYRLDLHKTHEHLCRINGEQLAKVRKPFGHPDRDSVKPRPKANIDILSRFLFGVL